MNVFQKLCQVLDIRRIPTVSAGVYKVVVGGLNTFKNAHARHAIIVGGVAEEGIIDCLRAVMLGLGTVGVGGGQSHAKFHENNTDQNWDHERKGPDACGGAIGGPHHVAAFINVFTGHGMTQNKCLVHRMYCFRAVVGRNSTRLMKPRDSRGIELQKKTNSPPNWTNVVKRFPKNTRRPFQGPNPVKYGTRGFAMLSECERYKLQLGREDV
ncbi:hypothetical protein R3P38DRAFT_2776785 [Favolaschia claudopus]|uniref:Uncharacterized protein n=1 Tax=Favolaschia claudopus TaxID=2862362 RepID=A0AAW0BMC4_9AGAR